MKNLKDDLNINVHPINEKIKELNDVNDINYINQSQINNFKYSIY